MGPKKQSLPKASSSKVVKSSGWLGKAKTNSCKKCNSVKILTQTDCVICLNKLSDKNVMLPKCQHMFCKKCIITYPNRDCKTSIQLVKLGQKQIVSEYLDLRSSPNQTPAYFFYQSGYTASLFHACNVTQ